MFKWKAQPVSAEQAKQRLSRPKVGANILRNILYRAPEPYKKQAWKMLIAQVPPDALRGVLYSAPRKYRRQAATLMLKAQCGYNTIFMHGLPESKREAAIILLREGATDEQLEWIILYAPEPYRSQAWKKYSSQSTDRRRKNFVRELLIRPTTSRGYRIRAAQWLLANQPDNFELLRISESAIEPYATQACVQLDENTTK